MNTLGNKSRHGLLNTETANFIFYEQFFAYGET